MSGLKVELNDAAMRRLYQQIADKIEKADTAFRQTHEGYPVEVVTADAREMMKQLGVDVPEAKLEEYARAVSTGEPFKWVLQ